VDLFWTRVLSVVIGFILASAFSAIVVYAQERVPGNVGMIAGGLRSDVWFRRKLAARKLEAIAV